MAQSETSELDEYAATVRQYCRARMPDKTVARPGVVRDADSARTHWRALSSDLGVGTLLIPEELGGDGASLTEAGRVAEALGAEVAAVPSLSAGVLAPVLLSALANGDEQSPAAELLRRLIAGEIVAVAWADDDPGRAADVPLLGFDADRVTGSFRYVVDGDIADVLVLIGARGEQIVAVEARDLEITPRASFDLTRGFADVAANDTRAVDLARGSHARSAFERMLTAGRLAVAAECAGGARAALDLAVDYAKQRVQFGREIGSFQAIKHLLADAFVNAESATSVARLAIDAYVNDEPDAAELVAAAAFYCADRFADVAATGIQVHGGIAFTVECAAHLYRRRAESNRHILGDPAQLRADYVTLLSTQEVGA